jgi:ABC-2 type transport system permease protein
MSNRFSQSLETIFWLGTKELRSFFKDFVLLGLVVYSFSYAVYMQSQSSSQELRNASIGIADEDHSVLSRRLSAVFLPPYFLKPIFISPADAAHMMDTGQLTFVVDIPPNFERDVLAGRSPLIQVALDATAMVQAGLGGGYIEQILTTEIANYVAKTALASPPTVSLVLRRAFNPNATTAWFTSVMGIVNNVTMLAIILAGAAIVREREHGTMDHLLVMPVTPFEIAMSKVWANGLVITVAVALGLALVVQILLRIPIVGSIPLFILGVVIYLFFAIAVGIFLGMLAGSMAQLGLLYMVVAMPLNMLSGANTPLEAMPAFMRDIMQFSPSTYFVSFAQGILFRGAGWEIVWPQFLAITIIGGGFLALALGLFRWPTAQAL